MGKVIHYGYKEALDKGLVKEGTVVVSYPDRRGNSRRGVISQRDFCAPLEEYLMKVRFDDGLELEMEYETGRRMFDIETQYDLMLIEIKDE